MKNILLIFTGYLLFASCNPAKNNSHQFEKLNPFQYSIQKKLDCKNGAVVSAHALASHAGVDILRQGGNAIDAAIAVQLALAVVYPSAGNLGGGGFMVAKLANAEMLALDYREMAPGLAHRDMYIDENGIARTDKSQKSHLSSGVPGTVAGLFAAAKYSKLSFRKLVAPAIKLAEKGFVISQREANSLNNLQSDLKKYNTVMPEFVKESPWKAGDILIQTDLANTLKRIRDKGAAGFYEGETARLITEEMKRGGGIITFDDLKNYKAIFREPHVFNYKDFKIVGMPMPSSGGLLLHQMMKMIEHRNISAMGFHSAQAVQLMTEVERRAFADRGEYMGDADFYKVPVSMLTNEVYLQDRMKYYNPIKATPSTVIKPGFLPGTESEETTHLSVIDKEGNSVAVTTTLNDSYGNNIVVGGAGFLLNNEMDDFSIKPGTPNMYGAIGGVANAIVPGKRMLSSMTPTIVLKDNLPYLITGTPGGTTIPTSVFQTLVNILEFNMSTEDAVNKPKFHHQWLPDSLFVEKDFPNELRTTLQEMGYAVKQRGSIGRTELIKVIYEKNQSGVFVRKLIEAVADNRGDDSVAGW